MSAPSITPTAPPTAGNPTGGLAALFSLSFNDLMVTRAHFAALDPDEFGWIVDGIDAELADRADRWRER